MNPRDNFWTLCKKGLLKNWNLIWFVMVHIYLVMLFTIKFFVIILNMYYICCKEISYLLLKAWNWYLVTGFFLKRFFLLFFLHGGVIASWTKYQLTLTPLIWAFISCCWPRFSWYHLGCGVSCSFHFDTIHLLKITWTDIFQFKMNCQDREEHYVIH